MMNSPGTRYGLWGGLSLIIYFLLFYFIQKDLFLNPLVQWSSLLIYIACMYKSGEEDMRANGTDREFRLLSRTPFITFILATITYWVFYYAIHLADPELLAIQTETQLEMLRARLEAGPGDPELANKLREQIQYLENEGMSMTLGPVLMQLAMGAIGGFVLSAAVVFVLKSRLKSL